MLTPAIRSNYVLKEDFVTDGNGHSNTIIKKLVMSLLAHQWVILFIAQQSDKDVQHERVSCTLVISSTHNLWSLLLLLSSKESVKLNKLYLQNKPLAIAIPLLPEVC